MNNEQVGGSIRAIVPALLTMLVAFGFMDKSVADAVTEPAVIVVGSVGTLAIAGATLWSLWKNTHKEQVKATAAIDPKDIKVVVGPNAPADVKAVASDPAVPNVVKGPV